MLDCQTDKETTLFIICVQSLDFAAAQPLSKAKPQKQLAKNVTRKLRPQ